MLAHNFDKDLREGNKTGNIAICVIWIGPSLNPEIELHRKILKDLDIKTPEPSTIDQTKYTEIYEITHLGEPICINEYMKHIATPPSVRVIQLNDHQAAVSNQLKR